MKSWAVLIFAVGFIAVAAIRVAMSEYLDVEGSRVAIIIALFSLLIALISTFKNELFAFN